MPNLVSRINALEKRIPEKRVILMSWMREEGKEVTQVSSGSEKWTRSDSETEDEFLSRISELTQRIAAVEERVKCRA